MANWSEHLSSIWEELIKKGIEYEPFIDWYWSVIMISFMYHFIWTNKIVYCRNIGLMIPDYHLSAIRSMPIEAITPIWYMVVAIVCQIIPATYWWSCIAYSGKSVGVVVNIVSTIVSIVSVVVLMVVENVLRAGQTLPSYQCRTAVVLRSYRQSWTDKHWELRPRSDGFVTIMTGRGGLLWSGTSAKNDRHSVTWA